ncbi:MAG: hypothetical protein ACOCP8_06225 [archaeon]
MVKFENLLQQLREVEEGCTARLLNLKESLENVKKIDEIIDILKISPANITYREHDGDNVKGYSYTATEIVVSFNKTNTNIKNVEFERRGFYNFIRRFEIDVTDNTGLEKKLIKTILELKGYSVSNASDGDKQHIYIKV